MTGEKFTFHVLRNELTHMLETARGEGPINETELFMKKNMRLLANQLMYKKRYGKRVIILSRKGGTGERGNLVLRKGKIISGTYCVVDVYLYMGNYCFKAYDYETSQILVVRLSQQQLYRWFDYKETDTVKPELLMLENREKLLLWFMSRMFICKGCGLRSHAERHRRGEKILMLEYEKEEQRDHEMACKLQGMWKQRQARRVGLWALFSAAKLSISGSPISPPPPHARARSQNPHSTQTTSVSARCSNKSSRSSTTLRRDSITT